MRNSSGGGGRANPRVKNVGGHLPHECDGYTWVVWLHSPRRRPGWRDFQSKMRQHVGKRVIMEGEFETALAFAMQFIDSDPFGEIVLVQLVGGSGCGNMDFYSIGEVWTLDRFGNLEELAKPDRKRRPPGEPRRPVRLPGMPVPEVVCR